MSRQQNVLIDYLTSLAGADSPALVGVITVVAAGAADDGNALVTVDWNGTEIYASYGASYTPVVGHTVVMLRTQPPFIVDRAIGTPPAT